MTTGNDIQRYKKIRIKILLSMLLVPLLPYIFGSAVGFVLGSRHIQSSTLASMNRIVADHSRIVESFLAERRADLEFVADNFGFEALSDSATLSAVFENLQKHSPAFVDMGVFDRTGLHVAYQGPYELAGKNYADAPWFNEAKNKGVYTSDIFLGVRNVPHFVIAVTRPHENGFWILRATIDTQMFTKVVEQMRLGKTGEAYIINRKGDFQTQRRSGGELLETDPDAEDLLFAPADKNWIIRKDKQDDEYIYLFTWINNDQWLLVARQAVDDAFATLYRARNLVLLIALLGGGLIAATTFYTTNRIINRIKESDQEQKRLNQQLVMAGRLAEIGEMSSGFAHEINNPLQIIRAETALMDSVVPGIKKACDGKAQEDMADLCDSLAQVQVQVDRCAQITSSILKFARQRDAAPEVIDLGGFVPEVLNMVSKKAEVEGIALESSEPGLPVCVEADASQLQQVLLNLVNNAMHAVISRHGTSSRQGLVSVAVSRAGKEALIKVTDNGTGISQENLAKIFTPFFSTKPVGQGTGLGLSICYGIVEALGGRIEVESQVNRQTTVTVYLPAV
jgi:two-component system NtrC family sensor kinase